MTAEQITFSALQAEPILFLRFYSVCSALASTVYEKEIPRKPLS